MSKTKVDVTNYFDVFKIRDGNNLTEFLKQHLADGDTDTHGCLDD